MANEFLDEELYGEEEEEDVLKDKYLTFFLADEIYGLDIKTVVEIIGMQEIRHVPDMLGFIKGVISLRGRVIPVMDVRLRVHMEPREYDNRTCIVVIRTGVSAIGLIVDRVREVVQIPEENIEPRPMLSIRAADNFISGMGKVGKEVIILLDIERLMHEEDLHHLTKVVSKI